MKIITLCAILACATSHPTENELWEGTSLVSMDDQTKQECIQKNDELSCMKFKVLNLLDHIFHTDNFKISDSIEITRNSNPTEVTAGRNKASFLENISSYITSHDVTFKLPFESEVKVSSKNIDDDELSFDVKFGQGRIAAESRKSKLKKVIIPILVFVLLKAITLIPLAIGVLGLKAWNALQLSFFSFIISIGLAIFQLCKKIAVDSHATPISAHGPWEYQTAKYRSFKNLESPNTAQDLAYSGYNKF